MLDFLSAVFILNGAQMLIGGIFFIFSLLIITAILLWGRNFFKENKKWLAPLIFLLILFIPSLTIDVGSDSLLSIMTYHILPAFWYIGFIWLVVEIIKNKKTIKGLSNEDRLHKIKRIFWYLIFIFFILAIIFSGVIYFLNVASKSQAYLFAGFFMILRVTFSLAKFSLFTILIWLTIEFFEIRRLNKEKLKRVNK